MKKKAIPCHKAGRITSFFLLISIFLLIPSVNTPVYAAKTYAQQTVFTLHSSNKTVKEILDYIEKNSEFVILYSKDLLPVLQKRVSISVDKQNVEDILNILRKYGISEEEVRLWGTGTPLREFLWSEEMADASVFVMEHVDFKDTFEPDDKEIRNCHINIGTGKEITIRQLAELIVNTVGYQGRLTFDTSKPDGTMRKLTDPGKLHALGWHHKIDIEEGVQRMYRWYLGK